MILKAFEDDDGNYVLEMNEEGADYLMEGVAELMLLDPGRQITQPSFVTRDGKPAGVAEFVLKRAADVESGHG